MTNPCLLVGDIGGTNARFALANPTSPGFSSDVTFECRDFASADIAINAYLEEINAEQPDVHERSAGPALGFRKGQADPSLPRHGLPQELVAGALLLELADAVVGHLAFEIGAHRLLEQGLGFAEFQIHGRP